MKVSLANGEASVRGIFKKLGLLKRRFISENSK